MPFLADSYDEAMKLYKAHQPLLEKKLASDGMMLLHAVAWPPQGIYSKKPINSAADLKGVKWRANSPATARIAELVGAQPVTVQAAEVSQAFATGLAASKKNNTDSLNQLRAGGMQILQPSAATACAKRSPVRAA